MTQTPSSSSSSSPWFTLPVRTTSHHLLCPQNHPLNTAHHKPQYSHGGRNTQTTSLTPLHILSFIHLRIKCACMWRHWCASGPADLNNLVEQRLSATQDCYSLHNHIRQRAPAGILLLLPTSIVRFYPLIPRVPPVLRENRHCGSPRTTCTALPPPPQESHWLWWDSQVASGRVAPALQPMAPLLALPGEPRAKINSGVFRISTLEGLCHSWG